MKTFIDSIATPNQTHRVISDSRNLNLVLTLTVT